MAVDLFAGIPVNDYAVALAWYEQLLGSPPTFVPNDTEAVWELAEHRYVYIEHRPGHAGHALQTVFVDDLDTRVTGIADRGLEPTNRETYSNGVRKVTYRDPDGNEIGIGGAPLTAVSPDARRLSAPTPAPPAEPCPPGQELRCDTKSLHSSGGSPQRGGIRVASLTSVQ